MNSAFLDYLASDVHLFLDGAMGTMLQASGMPAGASPDQFCLANPDILLGIHRAYIDAGSNIITSCTFGASRFKLAAGMNVFETNKKLAALARNAADSAEKRVFVAGDVGPTGHFAKPLGDVEPEEMINALREQIRGLAAGGVDFIFMETQFDLAEIRAAAVAARMECDLPLMASMTFEHGVSLTGSDPEVFAETMRNLDVAVVGTNCSLGPDEMLPVAKKLLAACHCPVMVEPNAGLPELRDGQTVFPLGPEAFAEKMALFAELGCRILGGCCGTTPAHIRAMTQLAGQRSLRRPASPPNRGVVLTSRSIIARIGASEPLAVIGERINPTGKPKLTEELRRGEFAEALRLADEQAAAGANVLDVNVGASLVDETTLLPELSSLLTARLQLPLSLDSSNAQAIAAALPWYPGSCLVNSINGEEGRMETLGPLCRVFGAPFILLPLLGPQLPATAAERIAIVEKLLLKAHDLNIPRWLVVVDILALAVSSMRDGGVECLKMARWCHDNDLPTTIGLSNISFGLPARPLLNSVFLSMAVGAGLDSCIANPSAPLVSETVAAMRALRGHDIGARDFIGSYAGWKAGSGAPVAQTQTAKAANLYETVLLGEKEDVLPRLESELARGAKPMDIINDTLIPAITEVGNRYERREYFLPQLIRAAETMRVAFARLKPLLEETGAQTDRPVVVMATVEGDIHDIGKNIVCLLLGNHGFEVIDAGKDVKAADIVACALEHKACIIGLSALMTTTMTRMEDTIKLVREKNLPIRVMVGGAAVTQAFADSIGADAYCADAVAGVKAARAFTRENGNSI